MEDSHKIKLKQYIEINLDSKPLSFHEILGKYALKEKLKYDIASDNRGLCESI